jgi:hypothetical protein
MPTRYKQDRRRDRHADRRGASRKPFVGVDGEGGNFDTGHEYMLLRAGNHALETGKPLTWQDCLPFLADLPKDVTYVAYFFDYDVTMILRGLPPERLTRLLDIDCRRIPKKPCSSFPIDYADFQIDYLPGKEFRVRRVGQPWTIISDVGSFFQCSFVKALAQWFPEPKYAPVIAQIAAGKEQRHDFGGVTEDERQYNKLEIAMLEEMMERFRDVCDELDIRPQRWQGPGNLVSAVFKREGLPRNKDIPLWESYPDVARFANDAYYGGRFEASTFGHTDGPVYQYDINSAYATTYRRLPCLVHGTWQRITSLPDGGLYLADVSFSHSHGFHWCTLPIRTDNGTLIWPRKGRGIYWSTELEVARKYGVELKSYGGWQYVRNCECVPLEFAEQAYHERRRLGKDGKGMVLKIFLASAYGKLAQSVGCAPYSNPVWAGLIVSTVRAQLIDAALRVDNGAHVLMLATDGLFTTSRIPGLQLGKALGEWGDDDDNPGEVPVHKEIFIVQSGVYFLGSKAPKTRGIPQARVVAEEDQFRRLWNEYIEGGELRGVSISLTSFVGLRLALARNKPALAGQWIDNTKDVSFDWTSKRIRPKRVGHSIVTMPPEGSPTLTSMPYSRVIGGMNAKQALDLADQPDWGDQL